METVIASVCTGIVAIITCVINNNVQRVKEQAEIERLTAIYQELPPKQFALAQGLIIQAARLRVRLDKLWAELEEKGEKFDVVILDPPAFTKSRNSIKNAVKGYREINIRGMKLVKDGGFLATCSCSHFMDPELFAKTIRDIPLGRFADPVEDIGRTCVFLASKDAAYITGETITLQGGSGLRP